MNPRKRLIHLVTAFGLAAGALVAATPTAVAATPVCKTALWGVRDDGTLLARHLSGTTIVGEKVTSSAIASAVTNMIWVDSVKVNGGHVAHIEVFSSTSKPQMISVRDLDASTTDLTVSAHKTYGSSLKPRLATGSGRYYIYVVGSDGDLKRWTRYKDQYGNIKFIDPRLVAHNMSGLHTLQYYSTYSIGGKMTDFLITTTASGALRQIRIPWSSPASETIKTLATSGFATTTGLSLSDCNDNDNYMSVIAVDRNAGVAKWYTLANQLAPKTSNLVSRGEVAPEADWHVHATF